MSLELLGGPSVLGQSRAVRRDMRGPAEGYGEVNSPGTGLETETDLRNSEHPVDAADLLRFA